MVIDPKMCKILVYMCGPNLIMRVLKIEEEARGVSQRDPRLEKGEMQSIRETLPAFVVFEDRGRNVAASGCWEQTAQCSWLQDQDLSPINTGTEICQQPE